MNINTFAFGSAFILIIVCGIAILRVAIKSTNKPYNYFEKLLVNTMKTLLILMLAVSILNLGVGLLFSSFKQQTDIQNIPIEYESGDVLKQEVQDNVPIIINNEEPTHIKEITYKWGFLYNTERIMYINPLENKVNILTRFSKSGPY